MEELIKLVSQWGIDKGIIEKSDPKSQFLKTVSEVGELADAVNKRDIEEMEDAVGDILVTLILMLEMYKKEGVKTDLEKCLRGAYDIISKRTGKMVNGVFVKDA
jgi:NTP pyrophosphatase (non-canonical NTP hydrolase)